jgi:hypothetical protein
MNDELNTLNIPAYKRKRSIAAKLRSTNKTQNSLAKTAKPSRETRRKRPTSDSSEIMSNIPARQQSPTIEDLLRLPQEQAAKSDLREMENCGYCEGYYEKINVAIIRTTSPVREGDRLVFEQEGGLFEQTVTSMQINRKDVKLARSGSDIGMKLLKTPKVGTPVYKVKE